MSATIDHAAFLRIAVTTETYPPEINGVAHTMRKLAEGLASRGHRLHLVRPRQPGDRPVDTGDDRIASQPDIRETLVAGLPIPGYRGLRVGMPVYWRLRRLWQGDRPDAVYIATQGPLGHAALAAARGLELPTLTGFHTQFHRYSRHYGLGLLARPIAAALRAFHNRSGGTLVPTPELQAELEAAGFERVQVLGRGVDLDLFAPSRRNSDLRTAWGCGSEDLAVLYVGRIAAEKNLGLAVETFEAIASRHPRARFVLVGDGPEAKRLQRAHPGYLCAGVRVGEDLAAHYASADLFLFPSETETFGNVVPEAMASGLPVVAFDYAAARALIVPRSNGYRVPLGDSQAFASAALEAAADRSRLCAIGTAARETALGLGWKPVVSAFESRLIGLIGDRCRVGL